MLLQMQSKTRFENPGLRGLPTARIRLCLWECGFDSSSKEMHRFTYWCYYLLTTCQLSNFGNYDRLFSEQKYESRPWIAENGTFLNGHTD